MILKKEGIGINKGTVGPFDIRIYAFLVVDLQDILVETKKDLLGEVFGVVVDAFIDVGVNLNLLVPMPYGVLGNTDTISKTKKTVVVSEEVFAKMVGPNTIPVV